MVNNKQQELLLSLLTDTIALLEESHIWYSLACGTVLGAVREGGFIPWDSDIDLFIKIDDVNRVKEVFENQASCLRLISYKTDTTSTHDKVTYDGYDHTQFHIDLYPLFGVPSQRFRRLFYVKKCHLLNKIFACKYENINTVRSRFKKNIFRFVRFFENWIPDKYIRKCISNIESKYKIENSEFICYFANDGHLNEAVEKNIILNTVVGNFEGKEVMIPAQYDKYLTNVYGADYMIPKQY